MDHFVIGFDFATTDRPTETAVYNQAHDVKLVVGAADRAIHAEVTLVREAGVVSVAISYTWFGGMDRDAARTAFVAALRAGQRRDGGLRGSRPFLTAVRNALTDGAEVR